MHIDPDHALAHLRAADPVMAGIIDHIGPFGLRPDGSDAFRALARAIVFQQISGAAAGAIYARLLARFDDAAGLPARAIRRSSPDWDAAAEPFPPPAGILALSLDDLRATGLSRQKSAYLHALAVHFNDCRDCARGSFGESDDEVIRHLVAIPGIGRWTAEMFLIFHLGRPDVLPVNDVGINRSIMRAYALDAMPRPPEVLAIGQPWRPYATVACWYLWRCVDVPLIG